MASFLDEQIKPQNSVYSPNIQGRLASKLVSFLKKSATKGENSLMTPKKKNEGDLTAQQWSFQSPNVKHLLRSPII